MDPKKWWADVGDAANVVSDELDADVAVFNGRLERLEDDRFIQQFKARRRRKNVVLALATLGGDSNAAYRMARYLQADYDQFTLLLGGECKSAGTLIALAANCVVMTELAELGPLDTQMDKKGELWELQSGLTVNAALSSLHEKAFLAFNHFLTESRLRRLATQSAADVAVKLASGLFSGIYSQIDPMHVGEAARSISIAARYGSRLSNKSRNLKEGALSRLISEYPTHGFVIDRVEAEELFNSVRGPTEAEETLATRLRPLIVRQFTQETRRQPLSLIISREPEEKPITASEAPVAPPPGEADADDGAKEPEGNGGAEGVPAARAVEETAEPARAAPPLAIAGTARPGNPRGPR